MSASGDVVHPDVLSARNATIPCALHHVHRPFPSYVELHHVIPQAWQAAWQPPLPWPNAGASPDHPGVTLWDARTLPICRTGHGNVHHWLVEMMRGFARLGDLGAAQHELRLAARAKGIAIATADFATAALATERWRDAGGDLATLTARGLWGEI